MNKNSLGILIVALGLLFSCINHDVFNSKVQLNKDIAAIRSFLKQENIACDSTPEKVFYIIDTKGLGIYPVVSDSVQFEYSISEIPNTTVELDSTHRKTDVAKTIPFKLLSSLIAGLQIGLPRFPVGSSGRLYIPSGLAYGTMGTTYTTSTIKGNANLLFTIKKVVSVKGNRFTTDTTAIKNYLSTIGGELWLNRDTLKKDPSGIRYWYDTVYSNATHPDLASHSVMDITYNAKVLSAADTFANEKSTVRIDLKDATDTRVITAWKLILPHVGQGSTVTMYVPSGYGYGSNTSQPPLPPKVSIAANSNLVYEIKLITVY